MEQMKIQPEDWKEDYKEFDEATEKFYKGEMDAKTYKGISGGFGSYAQRGGNASMLRLRMSGGVMDLAKLPQQESLQSPHPDHETVRSGRSLNALS